MHLYNVRDLTDKKVKTIQTLAFAFQELYLLKYHRELFRPKCPLGSLSAEKAKVRYYGKNKYKP